MTIGYVIIRLPANNMIHLPWKELIVLTRFLIITVAVGLFIGAPLRAGSDERVHTGEHGIWDGCTSSVFFVQSGTRCLIACPEGDGSMLADGGNEIVVVVRDLAELPVPNIPATDIWLFGCTSGLQLCGGAGSISADSTTGSNGQTTISGRLAVGGCDSGVNVIVWGVFISTRAVQFLL